ncbi:hypothetical protein VTK73DRAFT_883 [Phialemonium thermophilum]|uniref:Uncharacterized protein n=1 Tax=Phialemonium thermophilum TaxID=223376 RepID=A0ABR3Y378_9PEZI
MGDQYKSQQYRGRFRGITRRNQRAYYTKSSWPGYRRILSNSKDATSQIRPSDAVRYVRTEICNPFVSLRCLPYCGASFVDLRFPKLLTALLKSALKSASFKPILQDDLTIHPRRVRVSIFELMRSSTAIRGSVGLLFFFTYSWRHAATTGFSLENSSGQPPICLIEV